MERYKEVNDELHENNVSVLLEEIENGKVRKDQVKQIALKMHGSVHGVYKQTKNHENLVDVFRQMLDCWYVNQLYKSEINSQERLYAILESKHVDMGYLVQKMKSEYTQQLEESKAYTIELTNNFYSYSSDDQPEIHCFGPVKD